MDGYRNQFASTLSTQGAKTLSTVFLITVIFYIFFKGRSSKLPPGPRGWPIFGSISRYRQATKSAIALATWFHSLSEYGEMTTVKMGSKTWVFLNSSRVVSELISKRGNVTSERPYSPISSGLVSRHKRTAMRQTATWTEGRRVMHQLLNGSSLRIYGEWQELESVQLLAACLYRPEKWYSHHFRFSISVINRIVFGERLLKGTPDLNKFLLAGLEFIDSLNASLVDFFPWISRMPKIFWQGHWAKMGQAHYDIYQTWWQPVKKAISEGTAPPSFTRDVLLHKSTGYTGNDEDAMYLATSIVGGGSDNPRKVLNTFVMAALCSPDAFLKARAEIDSVCGRHAERLPTIDDMSDMPYVLAIIKELLRWRPPVAMIPAHESTQDIDFEGFHIPKGTSFVINSLSVSNECDNPTLFVPERWLDENVGSITNGLWQFGGGRRVCVGYKLSQQGLFVAFARLIYCFDYIATGPYDSRVLNHMRITEPFPVKVTVRGEEYADLITREAQHFDLLNSAKIDF